ncbi:MAG: hypothetical protein L6R42_004094 [Xanthoria sp. 1 TBL-2021]|nr:MAG: hypothetical protein L6R42_004094 [Xanthoria sp. 1 TBL-2021]
MMELLPPPARTPDHPPTIRRLFTAPLPKTSRSIRDLAEEDAETLYAHNAGKIVSFSPPISGTRRHSSVEQGHVALQDEPVGTLPWASATERTIAAGPLRIYRVLGSVAFLKSGATLKPILAKSQCWCVDGDSKFVLPVGPHTFYRIELPNATADDRAKVEDFKRMLPKVLQYETTPCPFKRDFTIHLPEKPLTPVRNKPWRPREPLRPESTPDVSRKTEWQHRLWGKPPMLAEPPSMVDGAIEREEECADEYTDSLPEDSPGSSEPSQDSEATDDSDLTPRHLTNPGPEPIDPFKTPTRPRTLKTGRAITAPPQLSLRTTPPSDTTENDVRKPDIHEDTDSLSSSVESFHSFHSPISPLPPSPHSLGRPMLSSSEDLDGIAVPKTRNHRRDDSERTVTADSDDFWDKTDSIALDDAGDTASPKIPQTPPLLSDTTSQSEGNSPEIITPSSVEPLPRLRKSRRRSQSPLPSPANVYSPSSRLSGHHLTTAILQKTCSMLLGPPVSLVALMLNIASRIMNGTYDGFPLGYAGSSQKIPCAWDFSDTDHATDDEDDYGVTLHKLPSSRSSSRSNDLGGSWEID